MFKDTENTKYTTLIGILFCLLRDRKVNATKLAQRFNVSTRTIYRYLSELDVAGVPIQIDRGRYGGISIPQRYKLPCGFLTKDEYVTLVDSLQAMMGELSDPRYEKTLQKIQEQLRNEQYDQSISGNILVDGTAWGDVYTFSDSLTKLETAVERRMTCLISYVDREGDVTEREIEPHLLVLKENIWYIYAYCHLREDFRLFRINRISSISFTGMTFEKREIDKSKIPLKFSNTAPLVKLSLSVSQTAFPELIEWLGIDHVDEKNLTAEANLPDDDTLIDKLLGFGTKIKVLSPENVREKVMQKANELLSLYNS